MSLKIISKEEKVKLGDHWTDRGYRLRVEHYSDVSEDHLFLTAAQASGMQPATLACAWRALASVLSLWALEGHIVPIPGLGRLRTDIRARLAATPEDVGLHLVKVRKFTFVPCKELKNALNWTKVEIEKQPSPHPLPEGRGGR